ncbi:hypothetical protein NEAUS03_1437 [Nematocida ausubeli]|nr:hypothetical protein NEAUS03_1437 [Nematocida ausubeli]
MNKAKQEGILILEDILGTVEEILLLSKITIAEKEKDIHREIKEAFQLKMKIEQLVSSVSSLHTVILDLETHREANQLWKESNTKSSLILQKQKNREHLMEYLKRL